MDADRDTDESEPEERCQCERTHQPSVQPVFLSEAEDTAQQESECDSEIPEDESALAASTFRILLTGFATTEPQTD
ncbi:hypothetical protein HT576_08850 [Haloterrigena sp. SYSU A121-1]|uniref:Uncharacterized protein n=1 Tax=Haloterrigena gelatinilytica TaxID=2741724 RepID=A0A8J8GKV5_9EURY|nr:hypothetical protein [Haloterrigena gelatinilytica]NUB91128.1 hypothetical protein [Haloterrigena gelatinilytica]